VLAACRHGVLSQDQVRQALLAREEYRRAGIETGLLPLLCELAPEDADGLRVRYQSALRAQGDEVQPGEETLALNAAQVLQSSREEAIGRPVAQDPEPVQRFLAECHGLSTNGVSASWEEMSSPSSTWRTSGERRFVGDYEVVREVARGGMGVIYEARHPGHSQPLAVKVLLPGAVEPSDMERFCREVEALARLDHPHIIPVRDVGQHRGQPFLVMDLVEGDTLAGLLRTHGSLDPQRVARIGAALAHALHHAHERGILHRDMKPANVLLGAEGRPILTDFGLARDRLGARSALTRTGEALGTPAYMAPEQAQADRASFGPATDLYGLGATLYELLAGVPPFQGPTPMVVMTKAVLDPPTPLLELRPSLDPALAEIVERCLEKKPGDRFPSGQALAAALEGWLRPERLVGVSPRVLAVSVLLAVLVGVGAALLVGRSGPPAESAADPVEDLGPSEPLAQPVAVPDPLLEKLARADALVARGDEDGAVVLLEEVAAADEQDYEALLRLHELAVSRGFVLHPAVTHYLRRIVVLGEREADPSAPLLLARAWDALGAERYADGVTMATHALEHPAASRRWLLAARVCRANGRLKLGDVESALEDVERVLAVDPTDRRALLLRGLARGDLGLPGALEDLSASLDGAPNAEGFTFRAERLIHTGRIPEAEADVERALALRPDDPRAHYLLGQTRLLQRDPAGALPAFTRATELLPDYAEAWFKRGIVERMLGDSETARRCLDEALRWDPEHREALGSRGILLDEMGDKRGAATDLTRVLELHPGPETERIYRRKQALLLVLIGETHTAYEALGRALLLDDGPAETAQLLYARATVGLRLGHSEQVELDTTRCIEMAPALWQIYQLRMEARVVRGDRQGAIEDLTHLIAAQPREPRYLAQRGSLYLELGELDQAEADLRAFLDWTPTGAQADMAQRLLGRIAEARQRQQ
jgi:tetratricopeptide (TPR) repeat protein